MTDHCSTCSGEADEIFKRSEVWSNARWRVTMSGYSAARGLCYLEPKRHINDITELDGIEAKEFGTVLSSVSRAIKRSMNSELVYVYLYGDHIPHLHIHLAPHSSGDAFQNSILKHEQNMSEDLLGEDELDSMVSSVNAQIGAELSAY